MNNKQYFSSKDFFCQGLPTKFQPNLGKILVTGASGYIGGRLVPELLERGYKVRIMVRTVSREYSKIWPNAEIAAADALDINGLKEALRDIDTAYYLIHSMRLGPKEFAAADLQAAKNFRMAAEEAHVKRIIYLGGLGDIRSPLSSHLRSRMEVAQELRKGKVPLTVLRAAIIVGSGSASYEIILHLIKRLRIIFGPPWLKNRCQPIALRDVIKYLVGVMESPRAAGESYDIGGPDILTYEQMFRILAEILHKKIFFCMLPFFGIRFYAYITSLITPVTHSITECLMESLKSEVICQDKSIKALLPFEPISYKEAITRAMAREGQERVFTRWSDAYQSTPGLVVRLNQLDKPPAYIARYSLVTGKSAEALFASICKIGGQEGWFHYSWIWRLRGMIDRILLGVGSARGRKSYCELKTNDVIDFWRVEDIQENKRLLLRAEMKLPGRAWLEFNIAQEQDKSRLTTVAYYHTKTFAGRAYWFACLPFHHFIFRNLISEIEKRS